MAARLFVHPAFYQRVRHYSDRIIHDGRQQVASKFVKSTEELILHLLDNPGRGHLAGFEASDLANILRVPVPDFGVFALFYRWDGHTLTVITLEHTSQDLPSRIAAILSHPK
jgi:ParE toxin of type II toxin-antitoxin system, parDE